MTSPTTTSSPPRRRRRRFRNVGMPSSSISNLLLLLMILSTYCCLWSVHGFGTFHHPHRHHERNDCNRRRQQQRKHTTSILENGHRQRPRLMTPLITKIYRKSDELLSTRRTSTLHLASLAPQTERCRDEVQERAHQQQTSAGGESDEITMTTIVTSEELEEYASQEGICLSFSTLGPGYRSVARFDPPTTFSPPPAATEASPSPSPSPTGMESASPSKTRKSSSSNNNNDNKEEDSRLVLGYVEGFVRPAGKILHLDKMEAFQPVLNRAKRQYQRRYEMLSSNSDSNESRNDHPTRDEAPPILHLGGISFGVGLLMGYQCLLYGKARGCTTAEFLAIDDAPKQHKRLVKYYQRVGFRIVKYVGDDWKDVPDRLVWGGCGTLMTEDIDVLLEKWSKLLRLMMDRSAANRMMAKTTSTAGSDSGSDSSS